MTQYLKKQFFLLRPFPSVNINSISLLINCNSLHQESDSYRIWMLLELWKMCIITHRHQQIQLPSWTDTVDVLESSVTEICFHQGHGRSCKTVDSYAPTSTFGTVGSTCELVTTPSTVRNSHLQKESHPVLNAPLGLLDIISQDYITSLR